MSRKVKAELRSFGDLISHGNTEAWSVWRATITLARKARLVTQDEYDELVDLYVNRPLEPPSLPRRSRIRKNAKPGFEHLEPPSRGHGARLPTEIKRAKKLTIGTPVMVSARLGGKSLDGVHAFLGKRGNRALVGASNGNVYSVPMSDVAIANPSIEALKDEYRRTHWGQEPDTVIAVKPPAAKGDLVALGQLERVRYKTEKGDDGPSLYEHQFENEKPTLAYDSRKRLFLVGGNYKVKPSGIEG